jgi:GNAT superfamily N-acetyltransferase
MPVSGVRLARTSDVDDIADVNVRAWRHRFAGLLPDAALAGLDPADLAMTWASGILNPPLPSQRVLVAIHDDVVAGYAAWGPCQDPDADDATGELLALEVDPEQVGRGHGSRLMAAAVDLARSTGQTSAACWTLLADEPRRAFLQSAGWGPDAAYRDVVVGVDDAGEIVVREARLVTELGEPA